MAKQSLSWIAPLSLGAALMYVFDPNGGRRRRALLRDQASHVARRATQSSGALATDLRNRADGLSARWRQRAEDSPSDDAIVEARVRSNLGRASSRPGSIGVASIDGIVTLTGPVLADEHAAICRAAGRTDGIVEVIDRLVQHDTAGSVPGLQGDHWMPRDSADWSSTGRLLAVLGGAALIAYGVQRRTVTGGLAASVGAGLLSRGLVDLDLPGRVTELLDTIDEAREMGPAEAVMYRQRTVTGSQRTGISNRETPQEEALERRHHPRVDVGSPAPQDAAGRVGEEPLTAVPDRQTSHKAGSRSIAQKEEGARYPDRSMPATRKVSGAFGREPQIVVAESGKGAKGRKRSK